MRLVKSRSGIEFLIDFGTFVEAERVSLTKKGLCVLRIHKDEIMNNIDYAFTSQIDTKAEWDIFVNRITDGKVLSIPSDVIGVGDNFYILGVML